jgi:hypothetical protein
VTQKEVAAILAVLAAIYPDTNKTQSADVKKRVAGIWWKSLMDIPFELANQVVEAHIISSSEKFMPQPSEIRKKCLDAMRGEENRPMEGTEAWALVRKALGNSYYGASEEFSKLPRMIQKIIGSPSVLKDWGLMPPESLSVEQSHFLRAYRTMVERETNDRAIPEALKAGIEQAGAIAAGRQAPFVSIADAARKMLTAADKDAYIDI